MAATSSSSAVPDDMHIYEYRLASFSKVHSRRRASNAAGRSAPPPLMWPHSSPSIEKLAKAGFYYRPSGSSIDNASCFLCKKSLDGWEPDDVPAIEHAKHSSSCGWAVIHATEVRLRGNSKSVIDDPRSEAMSEARKMTYGNRWPHDKKKGWIPKVDKLAGAGFHYAPTVDSDDYVQCAYCELGLDGWDPEDDPMEEHKRRQADCKFFTWKKPRAGRASSVGPTTTDVNSRRAHSPDEPNYEEPLDSDVSIAESTMSTTRGRKKTAGTRGRKPGTTTNNRRKPARGRDAESDLDSVAGSPPPATAQPTGRAPRGKKRTSSALGANRVSLFDANDFVEDQFAKPALPPAKPARQSKRSRASTASNAIVDEDMQMQYDSDASVATNTTAAGASKRKRGATGRATKAVSRYQIPDDEEIDRALELDLERELTEDDDTSRYTKPFIKTPKRRLTRTKMVSQIQTEGPPPALGSLVGPSAKSAGKKFTPAGMRNYFANQDLDYSLPISIPRHLAVKGDEGEFDHRMEEDTPLKVRAEKKREKVEEEKETEPEPMEEDEIVIVSEKITKKGGGKKGKKGAATKGAEKAAAKTTAAAVVAAAAAVAVEAPLPAKRASGRRSLQEEPAPQVEEPPPESVQKLRNIRKSVDGGMILFDGGASSSEDEEHREALPPLNEPEPEAMEEDITVNPEPEPEPEPEPKPAPKKKGVKKAATTSTSAATKGKKEKKVAETYSEPEPEQNATEKQVERAPDPEPRMAPEAELGPEEVIEVALPIVKGKKGKGAALKKTTAAPAAERLGDESGVITAKSPSPAPEPLRGRNSRTRDRDSGARLSAADAVVYPKLGEPIEDESVPPPEAKGKRATDDTHRDSITSNRSGKSSNAPKVRKSKHTNSFDDALAKSFAKKPTGNLVMSAAEPEAEEDEELEEDPVMQQLVAEAETAARRRSLEKQKLKESAKPAKGKGKKTKEANEKEKATKQPQGRVSKEKARDAEEKQEDVGEESDTGSVVVNRRASARTRRSIKSPPKYIEPSSSEEDEQGAEQDELFVEDVEALNEKGEHENNETEGSEFEEPATSPRKGASTKKAVVTSPKNSTPKRAARLQGISPAKAKIDQREGFSKSRKSIEKEKALSVELNVQGQQPLRSPRQSKRASESFAQTIPGGRARYADDATTATEDEEEEDSGETTPHPETDEERDHRGASEVEQTPLSPRKHSSVSGGSDGRPYTTLPFSPVKSKSDSQDPATASSHVSESSPPPSTADNDSTDRWTPIDVDAMVPVGEGMDLDIDDDREDDEGEDDGELLTTEEKGMTVQEWVRRNAERAEEKFRERCEGMIGRLVEEGRRAVRAIEGIGGI